LVIKIILDNFFIETTTISANDLERTFEQSKITMSIVQLYPGNFKLVGRQRKTMNITLPGNVLVFYKMQDCKGCRAVEPIFHQLASVEHKVQYAICDLTNARDIIAMSHQTKTQIQKVPHIILYCNHRPHARFRGDKNIPSLRSFIAKALSQAPTQPQQGFMQQQSGNMYGAGGSNYNQQPVASPAPPQYQQHQMQGQGGQGGQGKEKFWMPEIGKAPAMTGALRSGGGTQYAYLGNVEDEDEDKLLVPDQVIPHNEPWMSQYKKLGTMD
jgi:hypothetical protein